MTWTFLIPAAVTALGAIGAMALRNLVHCALCLVMTFVGLAVLYLQLNAEFVGFVQILVYVGAVAILIVFAILLTRGGGATSPPPATSPASMSRSTGWALWTAVVTFVAMGGAVLSSMLTRVVAVQKPPPTVRQIGDLLMENYVLPLEVIGLLLTAALIGAVVIAMPESGRSGESEKNK